MEFCNICGKQSNGEQQANHFNFVCDEHKKYATTFLIDIVSEKLGFKKVKYERKCKVCNNTLDKKELENCLNRNSFNFLCEKHLSSYAAYYDISKILE